MCYAGISNLIHVNLVLKEIGWFSKFNLQYLLINLAQFIKGLSL